MSDIFADVAAPAADIIDAVPSFDPPAAPARRAALSATSIVTVVVDANPQRAGTKGHRYFSLIESGATVQAVLDAGCARHALMWFIKTGAVTVS